MAISNYVESWKDTYEKYKSVVNFVAGDYETLKDVIRYYITVQCPENYNDWANSSEVGMFANGLSYLGESLHYRVDLNAHDVFPSTTERKQSLLNFTKMLSYSPKRNICANGIAKLVSVSTTQNVTDMLGKSLKDTTVTWNDSTDEDWLEHFLLVMNSAFSTNNPYGKPLKKDTIDSVTTQLYQLNNTTNTNCVYSFSTTVNGNSQNFEVVNADIDTVLNVIKERTPTPEQAFHILYRNDGTGNSSKNTGFFVFWKQGSLNATYLNFDRKIENNSYEVTTSNINEYDVWLQELDTSTGYVKNNWEKIANDEYLDYNNTDNEIRNIFKIETRENDSIIVRFSDGNFGTIPYGIFRLWYRVSNGNSNLYIKPADIKNVSVSVPYKSANTSDDNIYYLTMTFTVQDITHIRQSVVQESMEDIRERAPQVYSTQNRMVTGQDYNYFPKSYGSLIKTCQAMVRTYAGNSRYIQFNEGTGTYQNLNILAEDGYLYRDDSDKTADATVDDTTSASVVVNESILPLLSSNGMDNYYYDTYDTIVVENGLIWSEQYQQGSNTSYGVFVDESGNEINYLDIRQYLTVGNLVKFVDTTTNREKWASIISVEYDDVSYESYIVGLNEVLDDDASENDWEMVEYYNPFKTSFTSAFSKTVQDLIDSRTSFGLMFDDNNGSWNIVDTKDITSTNWLVKVEFNTLNKCSLTAKNLRYVFGSENTATFFFNTDSKISDTEFSTKDYIKVLSINGYDTDYYWKPCETIKYDDGYTDNRQVIVYGYNSDKDETVDNPFEYKDITNGKETDLYYINGEYNSSVMAVDSLWENTTTTGLYHLAVTGTVYPAGTKLPVDVTIKKTVKLSNGRQIIATATNPVTFNMGKTYEFDVVDEKRIIEFYWLSQVDPSVETDECIITSNVVLTDDDTLDELVYWNASTKTITRYSSDIWESKRGIKNLSFIWQHYASSKHLIDPCPTNIIDMYVLTNTYYDEVNNWIADGKEGTFPIAPSEYELRSQFADLENYDMISDSMVWHSLTYKVLFGNQAEDKYKATFRVVKSDSTTLSDNEIKKQVIDYIDEYFTTMKAGQTFYYMKLSSYIDSKMDENIASVLIVPANEDKFGNLFEIGCDDGEILISSATIDDVQIISKITQQTINIGN